MEFSLQKQQSASSATPLEFATLSESLPIKLFEKYSTYRKLLPNISKMFKTYFPKWTMEEIRFL